MAVEQIITLGIGTPSDLSGFLLAGLEVGASTPPVVDGSGRFPPVYTFIGLPYEATPSLVGGTTGFRDIYWPISQLVDGSGKTGWRSANTTGAVLLDLGSSRPCNFLCVFGHNFDRDQVLSVQMADTSSMTTPILARGVGVRQPSFWLDLRSVEGVPTTARYVQLAWVGNSRPATIGEVAVGLASTFRGTLDAEPEEQVFVPQLRSYLEYGKLITSSPGTIGRTMSLTLNLDPDQRTMLAAIEAAAATSPLSQPGDGARVVVIPSTHRNDAWYVEWPNTMEGEFGQGHDRVVRYSLTLVEEIFGVR